jgi:hypothetical protein
LKLNGNTNGVLQWRREKFGYGIWFRVKPSCRKIKGIITSHDRTVNGKDQCQKYAAGATQNPMEDE